MVAKCYKFFALVNEEYVSDPDFYRYCTEHVIGRANLQKGMNEHEIHVISCGKHKGECFAWTDVGAEKMRVERQRTFAAVNENRTAGVTKGWELRPKETSRAQGVTLRSPSGEVMTFRTMREMTTLSKAYAPVSAAVAPYTFTSGIWAGWTKMA